VVLDTRSGETGWSLSEVRTFDVAQPRAFTAYRLNMSVDPAAGILRVAALNLYLSADTYAPDVGAVDGSVLRTITATTPAATYSAAQQTTDFGGAVGAVFVHIYQMSGIVGRGIAAEAIA
jgi:hypothetical protein